MNKTPKLRFKEFSGDWEHKKFGTVIDKITGGGTPSRDNPEFYNGSIPWLTVKDLRDLKYIDSASEFITELGLKNSSAKLAHENDLIIPTRMAVGRILIAKNTMAINQDLKIASLKENYNTEFIYYMYLNKSSFIERLGVGSTVSGISMDDLNSIKFFIPSYEEQEKIASFFSLIDDKISLQGEKVEALKDYKKGMRQKIFSRKLRFKHDNGRDYPEWEEKRFGEVLTSRIEKQVPSQEAPLMAFTATGGIEPKGDKYDRSFLVKSNEKLYKRTELNDFIYSSNNLDVGSIGLNKYGTAVISDVYEIFIISKEASCNFISELIQTPKVLSKVIRYRQGVMYGQYRIHADEFLKIRELIPCLEEQNKIANFISNIDEKINKEQEKLDSLNEYKRGLLQQMFI